MAFPDAKTESSRKKFGELVRARRAHHTQVKFAESCKISQGTLSKIEQGHSEVPVKTLWNLAERLELTEELRSTSVNPPVRWGVCENADCPSVSIDYGGDDILFIPRIFPVTEESSECPFGHPLIPHCRAPGCRTPISPASPLLCCNQRCKHPLIDRTVGLLGRFSSLIIHAWDELETIRRSPNVPIELLANKTESLQNSIEREQKRRGRLIERVTGIKS